MSSDKLRIFLKIICYTLIGLCALTSIDDWINGRWSEMHNHINWTLWIGITVMLITIVERQTKEIDVKDDYIKSLEEYKTLTDEHIVSLKELYQAQKSYSTGLEGHIEEYKKLNVINEKIIEEYKNAKPSRF
jgi:hypothetical protein